jgi:hypothetical protein
MIKSEVATEKVIWRIYKEFPRALIEIIPELYTA